MALVERVLGRMNCVSIDGVKSGLLPVVSGCHKVVSLVLCSSWSMLMIYQTMSSIQSCCCLQTMQSVFGGHRPPTRSRFLE